jgi:hypothetical protein
VVKGKSIPDPLGIMWEVLRQRKTKVPEEELRNVAWRIRCDSITLKYDWETLVDRLVVETRTLCDKYGYASGAFSGSPYTDVFDVMEAG